MIKKIGILIVSMFPMTLAAQAISSVSYNPSRMGEYVQLKVSDKFISLGGLFIRNALILKHGATFDFGPRAADSGITYTINTFCTTNDGKGCDTGTVDFSNAFFQGRHGSVTSYSSSSSITPTLGSDPLNVSLYGGELTFGRNGVGEAYIATLNMAAALKMYVGTLQAGAKTLTIPDTQSASGTELDTIKTLIKSDFSEDSKTTKGLYLAGGDIPCDSSSNWASSNKGLKWFTRTVCVKSGSNECASTKSGVKLLGYEKN